MLVVAYLASYAVGAVVSFVAPPPHGRRPRDPAAGPVPRPDGARAGRRRRRRVAGASGRSPAWASTPDRSSSLLRGGLSAAAGMLVVLVGARLLRVREVTSLVDTVAARLRRG